MNSIHAAMVARTAEHLASVYRKGIESDFPFALGEWKKLAVDIKSQTPQPSLPPEALYGNFERQLTQNITNLMLTEKPSYLEGFRSDMGNGGVLHIHNYRLGEAGIEEAPVQALEKWVARKLQKAYIIHNSAEAACKETGIEYQSMSSGVGATLDFNANEVFYSHVPDMPRHRCTYLFYNGIPIYTHGDAIASESYYLRGDRPCNEQLSHIAIKDLTKSTTVGLGETGISRRTDDIIFVDPASFVADFQPTVDDIKQTLPKVKIDPQRDGKLVFVSPGRLLEAPVLKELAQRTAVLVDRFNRNTGEFHFKTSTQAVVERIVSDLERA
jgi:hypothetical protein